MGHIHLHLLIPNPTPIHETYTLAYIKFITNTLPPLWNSGAEKSCACVYALPGSIGGAATPSGWRRGLVRGGVRRLGIGVRACYGVFCCMFREERLEREGGGHGDRKIEKKPGS
jgi:hypothetical protein